MDIHIHIPATSHLSEYVTGMWEVFCEHAVKETILPHGIVEIVFNLGDAANCFYPKGSVNATAPICFLQGINTQPIEVKYKGSQHLFGIRLKPAKVKSLLGIVPAEAKDNLIDITLIKPGFSILWHQLKEATSFEERKKVIEKELPILSASACERTEKLCGLFLSDGVQNFQSIKELSQQVYYSPRHLNRKTQSLFGVSAEELITYKKFMHAVKLLHAQHYSLTSVAYEAGFFDQSHFCRIFKTFTGLTPKEYKEHKSILPFHIFSAG